MKSLTPIVIVLLILAAGTGFLRAEHPEPATGSFPLPMEAYAASETAATESLGRQLTLPEILLLRIQYDPFNLVATIIFFCAIVHTFLCARFNRMAHRIEEEHRSKLTAAGVTFAAGKEPVSFRATIFHFLGEIEAVFGIWLLPLFLAIILIPGHGWTDALLYIDSRNFTEPIFVVVIMAIASTRPVVVFAAGCLRKVAGIGKELPVAWWFAILTIAPLLGSFITEPAAMTIGAMLLSKEFFKHDPSKALRYATLGLLFVNVSVGGTLTHFAAPPVLMVASSWHWNLPYVFTHFGWKAILGITISNLLYFAIFRKELMGMSKSPCSDIGGEKTEEPVPVWIILIHILFLAWTVLTLHHPAFFVGAFLFFLAFTQATEHHQYQLLIRGPVLVGFFLAALVIHGGLQGWWISPILGNLGEIPLFFSSMVLTAFNDNAAITYLASQVPAFSPDVSVQGNLVLKQGAELVRAHALEYAVVAGAVTGGGLTVIANAPNPAGQSLLAVHFGKNGVSPIALLLAALPPTMIMAFCFMVLPH